MDVQGDSESENSITTQNLNSPSSHVDFGSSQVGTLETFDVASASYLGPFELSSVHDQSQSRFDLDFGSTAVLSEPGETDFGLFNLVSSDEGPR